MYFDQVAFGKRVKELRSEKGISQEAMAEILNISPSHYSHMEQGHRGCSIDAILELAEIFKVSTDYLLTGLSIDREVEVAKLENIVHSLTEVIRSM